MKATVFIGDEESLEPTTVDLTHDSGFGEDVPYSLRELLSDAGYHVDDYHLVSEYSLDVAVWALQSVFRNSRCHQSRVTAKSALLLVGETTDIETDADGMPEPVTFPGKPEDHTTVQFPWGVG